MKLSFLEHLEELRKRIILSVVFVFFAAVSTYFFKESILQFVIKPIGKLIFISPQEAFVAYVKISLFAGLIVSSPFVLFQIWKFISAGLDLTERKYILLFGPLSLCFFIIGILFSYYIIVPIGLGFLMGFATPFLSPMISIDRYISFISALCLAFGVIFELPLAVLFLTKIGIITPTFLSSKRRYAILLVFIIAAFLTPPDVVTQCLMAVPLLVLYELSIIFSRLIYKPSDKSYHS